MRKIPLLALLLCLGCADRGNVYSVRGEVTGLPGPSSNPRQLYLTHEAIDNYVDREGKVSGMDTMNMPFPVGKRVSLDGIEVGDVVEFDLRVDWESEERPVEIVGIRELPPDTELVFRLAEPEKHQHESMH